MGLIVFIFISIGTRRNSIWKTVLDNSIIGIETKKSAT